MCINKKEESKCNNQIYFIYLHLILIVTILSGKLEIFRKFSFKIRYPKRAQIDVAICDIILLFHYFTYKKKTSIYFD